MKAPTTVSVQETYQNIRNMIASKEFIGGEKDWLRNVVPKT